ncbi:MAG: T9SS type A sorting domain-containing protein [Psychroflexus halocasei]
MKTNLRGGLSVYLAVISLLFAFSINAQTTVTYDFAASGAVDGLNASPPVAIDSNIGFASFKNSGTSNPGIFSGQLRLYQNETKGGSIIIYAQNGVTITDVVVNASVRTGNAEFTVDGGVATALPGGAMYSMNSLTATNQVEFYQKQSDSGNRIYVDSVEITYTTVGPQITNIATTPAGGITSSDAVTVSADVTDAAGIANVALKWGTTSGSLSNSLTMANTTADVYEAIIPAQADGTTVYYALEAENTTGDTNTSTEMSYTVLAPNLTTLPYTQTFDADLGDTYNYTVAGTGNWYQDSGEAVGNGYGESNLEEYWMVLPGIDFSGYNNVVMSFDSAADYGAIDANNYLKLFYSTDYSGLGDPTTATWTELSFTQPTVFGGATASGNIDLSAITDSQVFIAFKYYSTDDPTRWAVDNINIMEETPTMEASTASLTGLNYMDTNGPSAAQSFDLSGLFLDGTQDVTVEILMGDFEVSLDDVTYADSLTLTNYDGTTTPIYVRLKAGYSQDTYEDFILINGYGLTEIEVSLEGEVTPFSEEYAGIGVFELISSNAELTDGYYVITNENSEYLMTNINTGYFTHEGVTVSNNKIEDPIADNVWYIEANGGGYTIYNEVTQKYVGWSYGNSADEDITVTDNARWTFDYQSGKFTVNNLNTPERQLSYNSGFPRFAAYGNDGQQELQLYKIVESPTADYTYTSGSWSPIDPNGMALPTDNIEVLDGTAIFNNAIEINNLSIATGATLEVKDVLTVNGNITNDGNIIFKSTAIKTAQLDEFNGTISGNGDVVVERFIPAKRAFRLLSSPVNGQTFADAWQQNTHITGVGGAANGFDPTPTNNPSLFIFNNSLPTQAEGAAWEAVTSTSDAISAGQGYRLMVRGDRTIDLTDQNATPTPTTLVSEGVLTTGNFTPTLAQAAGFYSLIGNPYQAIVDFSALTFAGDIDDSRMYVWDPTLAGANGRGAYVTVDVNTNSPSPSSSQANKFIMPGQAFFVQNKSTVNQAPSITFTESAKTTSEVQTEIFSNVDEFYVNMRLYKQSALQNGETESDAIGLRFADYYTTPSSNEDASKLGNPGENFAVLNDKYTSIDNRAFPDENEEIQLFVSGYDEENYVIQFTMDHKPEDLEVILNDTYTDESLELSHAVNYVFNIDSNISESIASDRFYISFENVTMGTTQPDLANAIRLYPNPTEDLLTIDVNDFDVEQLKLYSIQGQELDSMTMPENNTLNVSHLNTGVYIIKIITNQGTSVQKFIKK